MTFPAASLRPIFSVKTLIVLASLLPLAHGAESADETSVSAPSGLQACRQVLAKVDLPQKVIADDEERILSFDFAPLISDQRMELEGNVTLVDRKSTLTTDSLVIDNERKQLKASGETLLESESGRFTTRVLSQNESNGEVTLADANFYFFESGARGEAQQVVLSANAQTELSEMSFTTCAEGDEAWQLTTSEMTLNHPLGRGQAYNTVLRVGGVPVFYLPYLSFPIDNRRQTGLLFPQISNSNKNGLDFSQPVYWNITPSMDATVSPRWIEKRGFEWGTEFRWLTEKSYSQWNVAYLGSDKLAQEALVANPAQTSLASEKRWISQFEHSAQYNDHWRLEASSQRVSDTEYFRDFSNDLESANSSRLESKMDLSYADSVWHVSLLARAEQNLVGADDFKQLPSFNANADFLDSYGFRWQLEAQWVRFENPQNDAVVSPFGLNTIEGERSHIAPSISYPMVRSWGYLTPKLSYLATEYQQTSLLDDEQSQVSREIPRVSIEGGLHFERRWQTGDESLLHRLTPRFQYQRTDAKDQSDIGLFDTLVPLPGYEQLWRENRYAGIDRISDSHFVSMAVENRLFDATSGEPLVSLAIGRRFYIDDELVDYQGTALSDTDASPWLLDMSWRLSPSWSFHSFTEWNPESEVTNQSYNQFKFEPKDNHIVNLSHRSRSFNGNQIEEADFSFAMPINEKWRLVGRWYSDLAREQTIEAFAGIEYESCCWAIRLLAQEYLNSTLDSSGVPITGEDQYTSGLQLQFVFKGLGSAGNSNISDLLEASIAGYRDPFLKRD